MSHDHLEDLSAAAAALVVGGRRSILGIAGAPGAGKTTFTELLLERLRATHPDGWVAHLPMDGFHLADVQLGRLDALSRKGAPDTFDALGYAHLLDRVRHHADEVIYAPGFERTLEQALAGALVIPPEARLIITEGNYLLLEQQSWPIARAALDEVWYVTAEQTLRLERLVARHVQFGKTPDEAYAWVIRSDEANAQLVAAAADRADRVVHNAADGWHFAPGRESS